MSELIWLLVAACVGIAVGLCVGVAFGWIVCGLMVTATEQQQRRDIARLRTALAIACKLTSPPIDPVLLEGALKMLEASDVAL